MNSVKFEDRISQAAAQVRKRQERQSRELETSYNHKGPKSEDDKKKKDLNMMTKLGVTDSLSSEIYKTCLEEGVLKTSAAHLTEKLEEPADDIRAAMYKLVDVGLMIAPVGLNDLFAVVQNDDYEKILSKLDSQDDSSDKSLSEMEETNPVIPEGEESLYDSLKASEDAESKGLFSIASGKINPKDAVKAHEMMDTDDQMKAFMVQNARYELTRVVKLEKALERFEDKFIDNAMVHLDLLSQETLQSTMDSISKSLERAAGIIDKYYDDPELKLFVQDVLISEPNTSTSVESQLESKESREKIRNLASSLISVIDRDTSKVINSAKEVSDVTEETDHDD